MLVLLVYKRFATIQSTLYFWKDSITFFISNFSSVSNLNEIIKDLGDIFLISPKIFGTLFNFNSRSQLEAYILCSFN